MSRATSPPPAVPQTSSLPTITVGLCASAKKHRQSFDALREAGERHNTRLLAQLERRTSVRHDVRLDPNAGLSSSRSGPEGAPNTTCFGASSKPKSRGSSQTALDEVDRSLSGSLGRSSSVAHIPVNNYFFRFVTLNYNPLYRGIVVCTDDAVKGKQQPKTNSEDQEGTDSAASASEFAAMETARLVKEVDVVLHKVATFGTPSAIRALERWCKLAQKHRRRCRQPPLVVLDPLEKVQLLMTRSMLYKLLDNTDADGRCVALIPRTFIWIRPCTLRITTADAHKNMTDAAAQTATFAQDAVATPLGIHSFIVVEEENNKEARANGTAQGRWWITKPDECTGPAFTHHLVMWCTRDQHVQVPPAVQASLPKETNRFIIQELYVHALPVVIKVYCIAAHIYIKVSPTVNLLAHLWKCTRGLTLLDTAVLMDSQDSSFFSAVTSRSGGTPHHKLSQTTSSANYGVAANKHSTTPPPPPPVPSSLPASKGGESLPSPVALSQTALHAVDLAPVPWETMIAPGEFWDAFFAPGTPAYTAVSKLAQGMSGFGGLGLTLYGFDIVLVPQRLAHAHQRKSSRGIGHADGATVRYETAASTTASSSTALPSSLLPCKASEMFDLATGAPTPLLLDSVPVVIDVNYFPGYKGVPDANQRMMELMALKVMKAKERASLSANRSDDASGPRENKHKCVFM